MTCIVGLESNGGVWLGADSIVSDNKGRIKVIFQSKKVFRAGEYVMGYAGDLRIGQLVQHTFIPPRMPRNASVEHWMVSEFSGALRRHLMDQGATSEEDSTVVMGATFLVGIRGHLYEIGEDWSATRSAEGYNAIGVGSSMALGSLYTTRGWATPRKRVLAALEASVAHNPLVSPPFTIISTEE